jgi:sugar lactone lactonase YvrE
MSKQPRIAAHALESIGVDLHRPECVIPDGPHNVMVSDWRGGVTRIASDGSQETWLARDPGFDLRPNGIALMRDGSFLLANLGDTGGVWRLHRNGGVEPFLVEIDGRPLPPANFVFADRWDRVWISVSTRHVPRHAAWRADVADGFVVLVDARGARVVAGELQYTNEVRTDPTGAWLYVVETFGRRLTRFRIGEDGRLHDRATVVTLGQGCFPDGFAFDEAGDIWITSLISNRVLRIREARVETIIEDLNPAFIAEVEEAFAGKTMRREHLGPVPGTRLQQVTSVAFGGPDRRTVYLGSLHSPCLYRFGAEVAGAK